MDNSENYELVGHATIIHSKFVVRALTMKDVEGIRSVLEEHSKIPDLLAALKLYDEKMTSYWGEIRNLPPEMADASECWPAVRAAIVKMEGREP